MDIFHIFGIYPIYIMKKGVLITYDGSFYGFLSCIYTAWEEGLKVDAIMPAEKGRVSDLFQDQLHIPTHMDNAKRIWESLGKQGSESQRYIYFSFLSERADIQIVIFRYVHFLIKDNPPLSKGHFEYREQLSPWAQRVGSEKRYLETNMAFEQTPTGIYFTTVKPVYNVLPLLTRYCRNRFKQEPWALYDTQRAYGLRYLNGDVMRFVSRRQDANPHVAAENTGSAPSLQVAEVGLGTRPKPISLRASA